MSPKEKLVKSLEEAVERHLDDNSKLEAEDMADVVLSSLARVSARYGIGFASILKEEKAKMSFIAELPTLMKNLIGVNVSALLQTRLSNDKTAH